jgi:hypothetical protein
MERRFNRRNTQAFTRRELLVVLFTIGILALTWLGLTNASKAKARAQRIYCVNNMAQITLGFRVWEGDQEIRFPMSTAGTNGGTLEWVEGGNVFKHLQVMSNEIYDPKILICPADKRAFATNFLSLKNENISYFVALDATSSNPQMFLTGDRNITNGLTPQRTVLALPPDRPAGWTETMHKFQGNVGLADGSVQAFSTSSLREALKNTGDATNRIALPE